MATVLADDNLPDLGDPPKHSPRDLDVRRHRDAIHPHGPRFPRTLLLAAGRVFWAGAVMRKPHSKTGGVASLNHRLHARMPPASIFPQRPASRWARHGPDASPKSPRPAPERIPERHPGGMPDGSRWWSEATPPEPGSHLAIDPGRGRSPAHDISPGRPWQTPSVVFAFLVAVQHPAILPRCRGWSRKEHKDHKRPAAPTCDRPGQGEATPWARAPNDDANPQMAQPSALRHMSKWLLLQWPKACCIAPSSHLRLLLKCAISRNPW